ILLMEKLLFIYLPLEDVV
ncbi:unnamed protein product, partial [Allacma fusca]